GTVIETATFDPSTNPASPDRHSGVTWALDDAALRHPLLVKFGEWMRQGGIDVVTRPPKAQKYYEATPAPDATVVVRFDDDDDPAKRRPALVEWTIGKGKVLLLTTRLETPDPANPWNEYWSSADNAFRVVFP